MAVTQSDNGDKVPHSRYTASKRKCHDNQQDVADAWADGEFPTHNLTSDGGAELYTWGGQSAANQRVGLAGRPHLRDDSENPDPQKNFRGVQHPDGTGTLYHYSTREAIRTRNGLILSNEQCWSAGFAHCSTPSDTDATVPFDALERFLDDRHDVFDVTAVVGGRGPPCMAIISDGEYGVAFGRDPSSTGGSRSFAFRVEYDEVLPEAAGGDTVEAFINELLTPDAVSDDSHRVVNSSEYTATYPHNANLEAHKNAGGKTVTVERKYGDDREQNRQAFLAHLQGFRTARQGEWFFIPQRSYEFDPDDPLRFKPRYNQWSGGGDDVIDSLPEECPECDGTSFELADRLECRECGFTAILRSDLPDVASMDSTYQAVRDVAHALDTLGSHVPHEVAVVDGETYVRGTVRHTDGDHNMVNLGDMWHKAVTHDREVVVYTDGRPESSGTYGD